MGMELFYQGHRMIELGNDEPVQEHLRIRVAVDPASKIRFHESFSLNYAGVRINSHENAAGRPFQFTIKTRQGDQTRIDIAARVQSDLRKVGILAEPRVLEWGTLLDQINDPERRDFDAVLIGWVTEFRLDDTDLFHCEKRDEPFQWVGYCDPATDRMLETLPTIIDREVAKPLWSEYQRKIAHDQPYAVLFFQERLEGVHERLRNVHPDARGDWVGVSDWWLLPGSRRSN